MAAQRKYPDELRERAVKMVFEVREREGKGHGELARVARQLGVHREALRSWVKQVIRRHGKFKDRLTRRALAWSGGAIEQVFLGDLFPGIIGSGGFTASAISLR